MGYNRPSIASLFGKDTIVWISVMRIPPELLAWVPALITSIAGLITTMLNLRSRAADRHYRERLDRETRYRDKLVSIQEAANQYLDLVIVTGKHGSPQAMSKAAAASTRLFAGIKLIGDPELDASLGEFMSCIRNYQENLLKAAWESEDMYAAKNDLFAAYMGIWMRCEQLLELLVVE